ncbi:MAG: hypothetical protein LBD13_05375 [Spirochaetaceae bacterium]|nr:hypothetical protein [Spirochaetaceae bacterium]
MQRRLRKRPGSVNRTRNRSFCTRNESFCTRNRSFCTRNTLPCPTITHYSITNYRRFRASLREFGGSFISASCFAAHSANDDC